MDGRGVLTDLMQRTTAGEKKVVRQKKGKPAGEQLRLEDAPSISPFFRRWTAAAMILCGSILTVLFVANAIKVNELLVSVSSIEGERDRARRVNEGLRAELTRLMSVEQITKRASELGLVQPDAPPAALHMSDIAPSTTGRRVDSKEQEQTEGDAPVDRSRENE